MESCNYSNESNPFSTIFFPEATTPWGAHLQIQMPPSHCVRDSISVWHSGGRRRAAACLYHQKGEATVRPRLFVISLQGWHEATRKHAWIRTCRQFGGANWAPLCFEPWEGVWEPAETPCWHTKKPQLESDSQRCCSEVNQLLHYCGWWSWWSELALEVFFKMRTKQTAGSHNTKVWSRTKNINI